MALEKAFITPEGELPIPVLFNPTQYQLEHSNQIAEIGIPGLGAPILQYVRGNSRTLTMELLFDTYERQTDVRRYTEAIYALLTIKPETHVPPVCTFEWGGFSFRCVITSVSGRFTLFLGDGTPVRAILNVTFVETIDVEVEVRRAPTESVDHAKTHTVKRGETLPHIAALEYENPAQWRHIAKANRIVNPRRLMPGQVLILPPLR